MVTLTHLKICIYRIDNASIIIDYRRRIWYMTMTRCFERSSGV